MSLLRINSDTERVVAQRNVARADAGVARAMERLSSGSRINRASDDASGLTISEHMRAQVRGFAQDQRNIGDAIALVQTGEGALASVHSMLQRIRELVVQFKNGATSNSNAASIASEVEVMAAEVERLGRRASFNGIQLLSNDGAVSFQVGANDTQLISVATISLGRVLGTAWSTLGADTDLAELDAAIDAVSAERGAFGAVQNRLEGTLDALSSGQLNMTAAESRISDVDMAEETISLTRGQILSQAGTSLLAQANQANQGVLTLIR
jgi:flagellin